MLIDIATIFSTSGYGRPAVFAPGSGPSVETVVLLNPERGMEQDAYGENPADTDLIHVQSAVIPGPVQGDRIRLTDTGETFTVQRMARKSIGRIVLICTRNERMSMR
jgi:hypothetical protein